MSNLIRSNFQSHPFHLVSPSPWPINTSISLFCLTTSTALAMHNYYNGHYFIYLALFLVICSMSFWFRDIISESTAPIWVSVWAFYRVLYNLATARAITDENVRQTLSTHKLNSNSLYVDNPENFGYYLAGLLEGDGHISIPALFKNSKSTRVLNPRIVFTSHIDNLEHLKTKHLII